MTAPRCPKDVRRFSDGDPIVVVRPSKPAETLALAAIAVAHQSQDALREAVSGEMTFMGFLVRRKKRFFAVDENGDNPRPIVEGDVFVKLEDIYKPS